MNIVKEIKIVGFWGGRTVKIAFHEDINFLIGVNGSGKTTAINLIAATLKCDFIALAELPFERIVVQLAEVGGRKKPSIEVLKEPITFRIRDKASDQPTVYSLDELSDMRLQYLSRRQRTALFHPDKNLLLHLDTLLKFSWLSIHRSETDRGSREDQSYESTVDRKLDALSNEFVRYFSVLARKAAEEVLKFQERVFLSLVPDKSQQELFSAVQTLDLDEEMKVLTDIFSEFNVAPSVFERAVQNQYNTLRQAIENLGQNKGIDVTGIFAVVSALRVHSLVQEWRKLVEIQESIYEPRDTFLEIINGMLQRKELEINEKNELVAITQSGKTLNLKQLSSGEKQLLIILGEALLQEKAPWVYIADEPELSLHLAWQEQLIRNLRRINPRAQIIFATHSPDIVSTYSDRVFDMEQILG